MKKCIDTLKKNNLKNKKNNFWLFLVSFFIHSRKFQSFPRKLVNFRRDNQNKKALMITYPILLDIFKNMAPYTADKLDKGCTSLVKHRIKTLNDQYL